MKNYIRWLIANTRIRKATFELFWLACYVAGAVASIYFSIVEEWQNIFGLGFVFAMALNQWKRAKAAEVFKVGEIVGYSKRYIEDFDRPPFWAVDTLKY